MNSEQNTVEIYAVVSTEQHECDDYLAYFFVRKKAENMIEAIEAHDRIRPNRDDRDALDKWEEEAPVKGMWFRDVELRTIEVIL